jgi:hypothetical protein
MKGDEQNKHLGYIQTAVATIKDKNKPFNPATVMSDGLNDGMIECSNGVERYQESHDHLPGTHTATGRQKPGQPPPCTKGRIPNDLDSKGRMARQLPTKKGPEIDAKRKTIPEPVFGQTKEGRGLRRFLMRRLEKVNKDTGSRSHEIASIPPTPGWEG